MLCIMSKKTRRDPADNESPDRLRKPGVNRRNLATKLAYTVAQLGEYGLLQITPGRLPVTAYRTRAELILASTAPACALIEAKMIRGEIPHNESIFRSCECILDRVSGKARQQIDVLANEEGYRRLERIATMLALARGEPPVEIIEGEYKELTSPLGNDTRMTNSEA